MGVSIFVVNLASKSRPKLNNNGEEGGGDSSDASNVCYASSDVYVWVKVSWIR